MISLIPKSNKDWDGYNEIESFEIQAMPRV